MVKTAVDSRDAEAHFAELTPLIREGNILALCNANHPITRKFFARTPALKSGLAEWGRNSYSDEVKVELSRETILAALARLSELLQARRVTGELCLLGGAVMVLAFKARASTKVVDAIFAPAAAVREAAAQVAAELDLPEHWLHDGATGFVSARHEVVGGDLPQFDGLRHGAHG